MSADGDRFHVRYERTFIAEGVPIGPGRVLWAELRTAAKGTVAIHRFRTRDGVEHFWLASGQATTPPAIRLPVEIVSDLLGLRPARRSVRPAAAAADRGQVGRHGRADASAAGAAARPEARHHHRRDAARVVGACGASSYGRTPAPSPYGNWQQAPRVGRVAVHA